MTKPIAETHQFYLTAPSPCPYLPGKQERKVFTHLAGPRAAMLNDILTQGGFRRSQAIAYRPACEACAACVSVRVCADEFRHTESFRRVSRRNRDIRTEIGDAEATSEQYALFRDYLDARHTDGGMAKMTVLDYSQMIEDSHVESAIILYFKPVTGSQTGVDASAERIGGLVGCAITDILSDGLSMVYSFFDPGESHRSLGTFMILDHIERAKTMGLPFVYLGYWVGGSPKMAYKSRFLPQERLMPEGWARITG